MNMQTNLTYDMYVPTHVKFTSDRMQMTDEDIVNVYRESYK